MKIIKEIKNKTIKEEIINGYLSIDGNIYNSFAKCYSFDKKYLINKNLIKPIKLESYNGLYEYIIYCETDEQCNLFEDIIVNYKNVNIKPKTYYVVERYESDFSGGELYAYDFKEIIKETFQLYETYKTFFEYLKSGENKNVE